MPTTYCTTTRSAMDLSSDALRRDSPMGGHNTLRGYLEWAMVPTTTGFTPEWALEHVNTPSRLHQGPHSHSSEGANRSLFYSASYTAANGPPTSSHQCYPSTSSPKTQWSPNPDTFLSMEHSILPWPPSSEATATVPRQMRPGSKTHSTSTIYPWLQSNTPS